VPSEALLVGNGGATPGDTRSTLRLGLPAAVLSPVTEAAPGLLARSPSSGSLSTSTSDEHRGLLEPHREGPGLAIDEYLRNNPINKIRFVQKQSTALKMSRLFLRLLRLTLYGNVRTLPISLEVEITDGWIESLREVTV